MRRIDYLFDKIYNRRAIVSELLTTISDDFVRYNTIKRYYVNIDAKIVTDCVFEYINDKIEETTYD